MKELTLTAEQVAKRVVIVPGNTVGWIGMIVIVGYELEWTKYYNEQPADEQVAQDFLDHLHRFFTTPF